MITYNNKNSISTYFVPTTKLEHLVTSDQSLRAVSVEADVLFTSSMFSSGPTTLLIRIELGGKDRVRTLMYSPTNKVCQSLSHKYFY